MTNATKGIVLAQVSVSDPDGNPVTDPRTLSAVRVLLVAESCARYLQQVEGLGFKDQIEIDRLTNQLALNVIVAAKCEGKQLSADVVRVGQLLNIDLVQVMPGRMDS